MYGHPPGQGSTPYPPNREAPGWRRPPVTGQKARAPKTPKAPAVTATTTAEASGSCRRVHHGVVFDAPAGRCGKAPTHRLGRSHGPHDLNDGDRIGVG